MRTRYTALVEALVGTVLDGPGRLSSAMRHAAAERGELPEALARLAGTIHDHAWKVTDEDVARARAAGFDDDQLFELMAAAAVGASLERVDAGLRALEQAGRAPQAKAAGGGR